MSWMSRLRAFVVRSRSPEVPLPSRHERREAARERHHATGEPTWSAEDRHPGPEGRHEVGDITPGWPGEQASHRVIGD